MEKRIEKICARRSVLRSRSGMSMVNVIVAFAVLLIVIAMFSGAVRLSQKMLAHADSYRAETDEMMKRFYTGKDLQQKTVIPDGEFTVTDGKGSFTLKSSLYSYTYSDSSLYTFGKQMPEKNGENKP